MMIMILHQMTVTLSPTFILSSLKHCLDKSKTALKELHCFVIYSFSPLSNNRLAISK